MALDPTEEEVEEKAPSIDKEEVLILDDLEDSSMHEEDHDNGEEDSETSEEDTFIEDDLSEEETAEPEEEVLN